MKLKINDNKTIRDESINLLLNTVLNLEINALSERDKMILIEVIINGKSFGELKETLQLTTSRQRTILKNAVSRFNAFLLTINDKLRLHDALLSDYYKAQKAKEGIERKLVKQKAVNPKLKKILDLPIQKTGLSTRVQNLCLFEKIYHVSDLIKLSAHDMLKLRNAGKKSISEIESFLEKNKLWWEMEF